MPCCIACGLHVHKNSQTEQPPLTIKLHAVYFYLLHYIQDQQLPNASTILKDLLDCQCMCWIKIPLPLTPSGCPLARSRMESKKGSQICTLHQMTLSYELYLDGCWLKMFWMNLGACPAIIRHKMQMRALILRQHYFTAWLSPVPMFFHSTTSTKTGKTEHQSQGKCNFGGLMQARLHFHAPMRITIWPAAF